MNDSSSAFSRWLAELKRRKVWQVAIAYLVGGWLLLQVADATFEPLNLPAWSTSMVLWLLILGFPVAVFLAWALEVTPDGIRKTRSARRKPAAVVRPQAASTEAEPSIAVLPFVDMSPDKDQDHFCEGMAEEIINSLARMRGVHVASRTASFQFKGATTDIDVIGERLNVDSVLEGSVRKSGDHLRVTAQLINVSDGYHVWSEGFDRELKDVFGIQKEIAESVARAFKLSLSPNEERAIDRKPTENVEAYEQYLRGRRYFYQFTEQGFANAREAFSRAIELDPDYAMAFAGLADCFSFIYMYEDSSASNRLQAETNSRLALQLAPELAQVHASRGLSLSLGERQAEATQSFEKAIELDPQLFDAYYFYGRHAYTQGRLEKAAELFEQASEVRPDDYQALALLAQVYRALGKADDSMDSRKRCLAVIRKRLESTPDDPRALVFGAGCAHDVGETDQAHAWLERALAIDGDGKSTLYNAACNYALMGDVDRALDCLENSINRGMAEIAWIRQDSDLDSLREHPRFKALLQRA